MLQITDDGNAGEIAIATTDGNLTVQGQLSAIAVQGNGGDVTLTAKLDIQAGAIDASADAGNAGEIAIATTDGNLVIQGTISTDAVQGNGGDVALTAEMDLQIDDILTGTPA